MKSIKTGQCEAFMVCGRQVGRSMRVSTEKWKFVNSIHKTIRGHSKISITKMSISSENVTFKRIKK